jgi:hypothetical protein
MRPCARELDAALAFRMRKHDAAGADAALARLEARGIDVDALRPFLADADSAWHAAGVRALVRPEDRDARSRALRDPDPRVRRQAVRSFSGIRRADDSTSLLEVARVDPEPMVRTDAVRILADSLPPDGEHVVLALRDLWELADDGLREDIALAWGKSALWAEGGREALTRVVESQDGPGAIEAAAALMRHRGLDAAIAHIASAYIAQAIASGSKVARIQAIVGAPLDRPEIEAAVRDAARTDELEVRVAALARLAEADDKAAQLNLEALARAGSTVARHARFALASAGDRRVQAWIEGDLDRPDAGDRLAAGVALAVLGVPGRAAPLLADADPAVRSRAACAILMAERHHR